MATRFTPGMDAAKWNKDERSAISAGVCAPRQYKYPATSGQTTHLSFEMYTPITASVTLANFPFLPIKEVPKPVKYQQTLCHGLLWLKK
jgi:hypothetical protein